MDRIYASSVLTLICVPPDPDNESAAYDGLPGFRIGTRISKQDIEQVKGLDLLTAFVCVDYALDRSPWNSRSWTFQEGMLSRRKLYFTEMQLYFQCSCNIFCEDAFGEGGLPSSYYYQGSNLYNLSGIRASRWSTEESELTWLNRSPYRNPVESINAYKRLSNHYSGRDMSDPGDILHAFQGLLFSLQQSMRTEFWVGLPESYLHEALLWIEIGPHLRRNILANNSTRQPFPSWSWAGWETKVEAGDIFEGYIRPETDLFIINQTGMAIQLTTPGAYNHLLHPQVTQSNKIVRPPGMPPKEFLEKVQPRIGVLASDKNWAIPRFLACWTSIASFMLTGETFDLNGYGAMKLELRENFIISDSKGNSAGSIMMEKRRKTEPPLGSRMLEFMLLSRSSTMAEEMIFLMKEFSQTENGVLST